MKSISNTFAPGIPVAVPCSTQPGLFPGEFLGTVNTVSGPVSGFALERDMVARNGALCGVVSAVDRHVLAVRLKGSVFTTSGLAELSADWARDHVTVLAA